MSMPLAESERGHRRGAVLGFTMAELLLLLLFCLLLVSTTALLQRDQELSALRAQIGLPKNRGAAELTLKAASLDKLLASLFPDGVPRLAEADLTKLWQTLVLARDQNAMLTPLGLDSPEELQQLLTVWGEMQGRFASEAELKQLVEKLQTLVDAGSADLSPEELDAQVEAAQNGILPGNRWPPIISLDGNHYRFQTGSAEIMPEFRRYLEAEAAKRIKGLLTDFQADVIEIVGHTDEQVIEPKQQTISNLDRVALPALNGETNQPLIPVDNAGLGFARAIEVAKVLRSQPELAGYKFVPMSAGQLLRRGDLLSTGDAALNDPDRRRIEIRVRRSTPEAEE